MNMQFHTFFGEIFTKNPRYVVDYLSEMLYNYKGVNWADFRGTLMDFKIIVVASSKGGVGKSTVALGLSQAMAKRGEGVLICDLDFGNACLDMLTGCENDVVYTVADAASGRCAPEDAVIDIESLEISLLACPSGGRLDTSELDGNKVIDVVKSAAEYSGASVVIIDTSAGVNPITNAAAKAADTVLVVSGHNPISLRAAESTVSRFSAFAEGEIKLVVNQFDAESVLRRRSSRKGLLGIIDSSRAPLAGVVPYDYGLMLNAEGVKGDSDASRRAFANIAARLSGEDVPLFSKMKRLRKKRIKLYK